MTGKAKTVRGADRTKEMTTATTGQISAQWAEENEKDSLKMPYLCTHYL